VYPARSEKKTVWIGLGFLFFLIFTPSARCQASKVCLMCHSNTSIAMNKGGRKVSLFVNSALLKASVHGSMNCTVCHNGFNPGARPHAKVIKPVPCRTCHATPGYEKSIHGMLLDRAGKDKASAAGCKACHGTHEIRSVKDPKSPANRLNVSGMCAKCHGKASREFQASAHGVALAEGMGKSPSCITCHGSHNINRAGSKDSALFKTNEAKFCLRCHLDDPEIRKKVGASVGFIASYQTSVHGVALASGNQKAATCSDCHRTHDLKKATDSSSSVNKQNIAETCSRCHFDVAKTYNESIHGISRHKGSTDAPTCTDCHGEHQIYAPSDPRSRVAPKNVSEQVCATCHNSVQLNQKYGIASDRIYSFSDSYHGLAARAGSVAVANCASCHGVHNIKPSSDPASTVNQKNLAATCGRCHPGANENFARGAVHIVVGPESKEGILYWIRAIYIALIIITIGGMFLHNLLDFVKKTRHQLAVRRGKILPEHHGTARYIRMTLHDRIQHALMFSSFILLAITGFMLRFPDSWWVVPIRQLSEKFFDVRSILHRVAGVVMIAISIYHFFYIVLTKRGRRFVGDVRPMWKDVGAAWTNIGYLLGFSKKKPLFDRFGYIEKAEYWALVWGVLVMAGTGIIMWFDNYFIGLLTKLGWDISRTIHFYEACLATLAILVWHFYFVIFRPGVYPGSTAWITGKISEEEMAEEHPLELNRIKSAQLKE
jgi:predicted CXXCH cytochrome family protein